VLCENSRKTRIVKMTVRDGTLSCRAVHEITMSLIAVWCEAVNIEDLCLDSIGERDGFCPVQGEGVPSDVEFDEGFREGGRRVAILRVFLRILVSRVVPFVHCVLMLLGFV
jgi:hypothetical protein